MIAEKHDLWAHMQFRESDLELMRAAVAKLDAEKLERKS